MCLCCVYLLSCVCTGAVDGKPLLVSSVKKLEDALVVRGGIHTHTHSHAGTRLAERHNILIHYNSTTTQRSAYHSLC